MNNIMASDNSQHLEIREAVPEFVSVKEEISDDIRYSYQQVYVAGSNNVSNVDHDIKKESYDETNLSLDQFQQDVFDADGSESNIECSDDRKTKQEREIQTVITDFEERLKDQKVQVCSTSFKRECDNLYRNVIHENSESSDFVSNMNIDIFGLVSSGTETEGNTSTPQYNNINTNIHTTEKNIEYTANTLPLIMCSNDSKGYQETSETVFFPNVSMVRGIKSEEGILETSTTDLASELPSEYNISECNEVAGLNQNLSNDLEISSSQRKLDTNIGHNFECKVSGAKFTERRNLKLHMRKHTDKEFFECNTCGSKFSQNCRLNQHMRIHTGEKPFECNLCGYKFKEKGTLKHHMRKHTGEKPFECNTCGSKFTRKGSLELHMRIHTGDKPFECNICGYKFTEKSSLKKHMRKHTGENPFQCDTCGSKFSQNSTWKQHLRIHTGDKPFKCNICGYKFTRRDTLKQHMRKHTGEEAFQCNTCGYIFTRKGSLKRHMRTHTGDKPFCATYVDINLLKEAA